MEGSAMAKTRVFISFDYDNDVDLKNLLVGQSRNDDSPFEISDWSIKETVAGDWKEEARKRIVRSDVVAVICGEHTDAASGVSAEVRIAQDEGVDYFLLHGRVGKNCKRPKTAMQGDKMYDWTWNNLKVLVGRGR
jgi:hypothetical protein